jgi:nucleoid-associated protein YgaU
MQPIERVGVFALLFLVVTVVAVVMWDREPESLVPVSHVAAKEKDVAREPQRSEPAAPRPRAASAPVSIPKPTPALPVSSEPRPLTAPPAARSKAEEDAKERAATTPRHEPRNRPADVTPSTSTVAANTAPAFQAPTRPPVATPTEKRADKSDAKGSSTSGPAYTVKKGDVLGKIAEATLGSSKRWKEIASLNPGVDPDRLTIGAVLRLPVGAEGGAPSVATTRTSTAAAPRAGAGYTIRTGDSLWVIAERELGDGSRWAEIAALNPTLDADKLIVGRAITLPDGRSAPRSAAVAQNARPTSSRPKTGVVR